MPKQTCMRKKFTRNRRVSNARWPHYCWGWIASCLSNDSADEELEDLLKNAESTMANGQKYQLKALDVDGMSVELSRRKYLLVIIAAKHNPTDELLVLVAELRGQLQASLLLSGNGCVHLASFIGMSVLLFQARRPHNHGPLKRGRTRAKGRLHIRIDMENLTIPVKHTECIDDVPPQQLADKEVLTPQLLEWLLLSIVAST
ncbi:hypothetical protein GOP47_0011684 [Adiantum capillus-veneris]|uniref:Uncharacterized protein n=1 Tax=Adiantum capillus-veneris TaxID=13818 RepID=A0A9D4UTD8_ADICA|nr:hypothetical protein GOP47_0011684 [Adiantum capillus-veneris]